jgi:hypothetical protein
LTKISLDTLWPLEKTFANFWATFFQTTNFVLNLTKHALGYILGDLKNSSGHPGSEIYGSTDLSQFFREAGS